MLKTNSEQLMLILCAIILLSRYIHVRNFDFVYYMPCDYRRLTLSAWAIHVGSAGHFISSYTSR